MIDWLVDWLSLKQKYRPVINNILGVLGQSSEQKKDLASDSSSGPPSCPPSGGGKYFYVFLFKIF